MPRVALNPHTPISWLSRPRKTNSKQRRRDGVESAAGDKDGACAVGTGGDLGMGGWAEAEVLKRRAHLCSGLEDDEEGVVGVVRYSQKALGCYSHSTLSRSPSSPGPLAPSAANGALAPTVRSGRRLLPELTASMTKRARPTPTRRSVARPPPLPTPLSSSSLHSVMRIIPFAHTPLEGAAGVSSADHAALIAVKLFVKDETLIVLLVWTKEEATATTDDPGLDPRLDSSTDHGRRGISDSF
ncbi:hypothetical protein BKA70DRAFT_1238600 [Coprinopsis sp. MPI-PUGE-AT-0042]|nr:hypothetical protein BKA70DRAFT_1238600 [Coprinopsis sp. MPI-PUGE-AT-0042]